MHSLIFKGREVLFVVALLIALVLYYALAMKVFHSINLVFIALVVFSALLIMVSGSPFRIFLVLVLSGPLSATMAIDIGFTIIPAYILLLLLIFIMVVSREFWYSGRVTLGGGRDPVV